MDFHSHLVVVVVVVVFHLSGVEVVVVEIHLMVEALAMWQTNNRKRNSRDLGGMLSMVNSKVLKGQPLDMEVMPYWQVEVSEEHLHSWELLKWLGPETFQSELKFNIQTDSDISCPLTTTSR